MLFKVTKKDGLVVLGLDDGLELQNEGWLLLQLHDPVKFRHPMVDFLFGPSTTTRFLSDSHPHESRLVNRGLCHLDMTMHESTIPLLREELEIGKQLKTNTFCNSLLGMNPPE